MTDEEYLKNVLKDQTLADDSDEMKDLRTERDEVEKVLRDKYAGCDFTTRYGGSKAKGTLIKEMYDLDLVFYLHDGENGGGETLEDIFFNVAETLRSKYTVREKTSALRLTSNDPRKAGSDLHIDVVPGRFTSDDRDDCYLYQNSGDKERLKTNLDTHIAHVRDSGVLDALRLLKLLRVRRHLSVKQFAWELLAVKLLKSHKKDDLLAQLDHVLEEIENAEEAITIEDPANPTGNDLMPLLRDAWWSIRNMARDVRAQVKSNGWEAVFGAVEAEKVARVARLTAAAQSARAPIQPWDMGN
jgi:hypothetical protein